MKHVLMLLALLCLACVPKSAQPAIDAVQRSWGPAERLMHRHRYAAAEAEVQSTKKYLPLIADLKLRNCVAGGANLRIVSARAGAMYLAAHPHDNLGAERAADRAWTAYPLRHDCP